MLLPVRKYRPEDTELLCRQAVEQFPEAADFVEQGKFNASVGPAETIEINGKPVVSAGIRIIKTDAGEMIGWPWFVVSALAGKYKLSILQTIKSRLYESMKDFGLSRAITDSRKGFEQSQMLLRHLGFKKMEKETDTHYFYELRI